MLQVIVEQMEAIQMHIELNMNQKMSLSPKMLQSVEILQMGNQELLEYVRQQATENPVVEIEEPPQELDKFDLLKKKIEWLDSANEKYRIYYNEIETEDERNRDIVNYTPSDEEDLYQYLQSQLNLIKVPDDIRKAVKYMIGCVNENGYLELDLEEIANNINIELCKAKEALHLFQSFEPHGVGARNLIECLLIQLERNNQSTPIAIELVKNYLEMLGKNQLELIANKLGVSINEIKDAYKVIKKLNPRPGSGLSKISDIHYLTPDLIVVKFSDYYEVLLNDYFYPRISINNYYKNIIKQNLEKDTKQYITDKIKEADWVMKSISQRNSTLLKVTRMIVQHQKGFFDKGPGHLIPLHQKNIADDLEIHESTVSRAIRNKYLQCPWGIFKLDYFFTNGLCLADTSNIVPDKIKSEIKEIIISENKQKPYSDQQIADILNKKGIDIARRTVSKYREELNIDKASLRKEY